MQHSLLLLQLQIFLLVHIRETPLTADNNLLPSGELITGTTERLHNNRGGLLLATDGKEDLANVDTSDGTVGLSPGTTHTGLKPISTGTTQHLVDTDNMVRMHSDTQMEGILSARLGNVLV